MSEPGHPTAEELFHQCGISRAAIIDDIYDPPGVEFVGGRLIREFLELVVDDDEASKAFTQLSSDFQDIRTADDMTDEAITLMWERRDALGPLQPAFDSTLGKEIQRRKEELNPLQESLRSVGFDVVHELGSDEERYGDSYHLVFIDFNLRRGDSDGEWAKKIIEQISASQREHPPFYVLMSELLGFEKHVESICTKANQFRGMFEYLPKLELYDEFRREISLQMIASALVRGRELQGLFRKFPGAIDSARDKFIAGLNKLTLADYVYISRLSLEAGGQGLGQYLFWLFGAYFDELLFVRELESPRLALDQKGGDQEDIASPLVNRRMPTAQLAKLYRGALFEAAKAVDNGDKSSLPGVRLGDVFIRGEGRGAELLMVINNECDLIFSEVGGRGDSGMSVLLISGRLQSILKPVKEKDRPYTTDLYEHQGQLSRIYWNRKRVVVKPLSGVNRWLKDEHYVRSGRLRLPYALAVQRAFASDLGRVGMPVAPPLYQPCSATILCWQDGCLKEVGGQLRDSVFVAVTPKELRCVLTVDVVVAARDALSNCIEDLTMDKSKMNIVRNLQDVLEDADFWRNLFAPHELPTGWGWFVKEKPVRLVRKGVPLKEKKPKVNKYAVVVMVDAGLASAKEDVE